MSLFAQSNFENLQDTELDNAIQTNIDKYKVLNMIGIVLSVALMSSQLFKILFNIFSSSYIPADRWTKAQFISAIVNMITFLILNNMKVTDIKNLKIKQFMDILIILVTLFTWLKFFSFFLVIKGVSNHFIAIYKMFNNALNFILMVFAYQLFMAITVKPFVQSP